MKRIKCDIHSQEQMDNVCGKIHELKISRGTENMKTITIILAKKNL